MDRLTLRIVNEFVSFMCNKVYKFKNLDINLYKQSERDVVEMISTSDDIKEGEMYLTFHTGEDNKSRLLVYGKNTDYSVDDIIDDANEFLHQYKISIDTNSDSGVCISRNEYESYLGRVIGYDGDVILVPIFTHEVEHFFKAAGVNPGPYHNTVLPKTEVGTVWNIQEELTELLDVLGNSVQEQCELSDLLLSIRMYCIAHGYNYDDLFEMSNKTYEYKRISGNGRARPELNLKK